MFYQRSGDSFPPMYFIKGGMLVSANDKWLGQFHGCDFFMRANQLRRLTARVTFLALARARQQCGRSRRRTIF
jgi:uncharacterized protein (DUF779 family)